MISTMYGFLLFFKIMNYLNKEKRSFHIIRIYRKKASELDNIELSRYRLARAEETLIVAKELYTNKHYKNAINPSYYAFFFFAMRAVFALQNTD